MGGSLRAGLLGDGTTLVGDHHHSPYPPRKKRRSSSHTRRFSSSSSRPSKTLTNGISSNSSICKNLIVSKSITNNSIPSYDISNNGINNYVFTNNGRTNNYFSKNITTNNSIASITCSSVSRRTASSSIATSFTWRKTVHKRSCVVRGNIRPVRRGSISNISSSSGSSIIGSSITTTIINRNKINNYNSRKFHRSTNSNIATNSKRRRGSKPMTTALTWKSLHRQNSRSCSGSSGRQGLLYLRLRSFPSQMAMWAGIVKLIVGALMAGLGGVGLAVEAALSPLGGGLWAGAVVGLSGFLAVCAARRPQSQVYMVSLVGVSLLSLSASGLLLALSAAAWAADTGAASPAFLQQVGLLPLSPPPPSSSMTAAGGLSPAVLVSGGLVLLAVVDCLVSVVCVAIAARQMCRALSGVGGPGGRGLSEGHNRKERLYRWLGQQKTIFPIGTTTTGASRGADACNANVPSVCQFVPLTESSSTGSLDQLPSHEGGLHSSHPHHSSSSLTHLNTVQDTDTSRDGHHAGDAQDPLDRMSYGGRANTQVSTDDIVVNTERFTYLGNGNASHAADRNAIHSRTKGQNGNTFAKYANFGGIHGRYETSHYDVGHYKNVYAQNPYSRRSSSGKLSHAAVHSGNSTLHSTLASTSTRPGKSGLSVTTKNSTGSSQLTTSAYLSSSSESRHAKSTASFPVKPSSKSSKVSQRVVPPSVNHINHYPSLPHLPPPPSANSVVLMAPPPAPAYSQYAPSSLHHRPRPSSERYYPLGRVTLRQHPQHQHQQFQQHQQQGPPSNYYALHHSGQPEHPVTYQSLPPPRTHYVQMMPPQQHQYSSHMPHPSMYYPHLVTPMVPNYHYVQNYDNRTHPRRSQKPYTAVHSSKLTKKKKTKSGSRALKRIKRQSLEKKQKKKSRELTDEQIDRSYTGLDRAIAEGFINTMMKPAMSSAPTRPPLHGYCR